jgi:ATP-dependent Clp protease ATP-binding subunit ClpA
MNILLQVLDDGRITDSQGREVDFSNTVIVMTTNAGSDSSSSVSGFSENREVRGKEKTERALSAFLRPEFINRIDEIITFRHLDKSDFVRIAEIMMSQLKQHLSEQGIKLAYNSEVTNLIAENSYSEKYGARNMRRYIEQNVEDKIANVIIDNFKSSVSAISLTADKDQITVSYI